MNTAANPTVPAPEGVETLQLGQVSCDFIRQDAFQAWCEQLLQTTPPPALQHVVTLNPEMVMLAEEQPTFREAVKQADLRVPDGAGLIWAQWYIRSQFWSLIPSLIAFSFRDVERITGVDTVWLVARLCARFSQPLYLLGGTLLQVKETARQLQQQLPKLTVFTSPDHAFDIDGPATILADIQQKKPAVLLVAYGPLKQIPWIEQHRHSLPQVRLAVGVGGAFAILSEERPRAPKFLRQLNLEWLWRLLLEPTRLPRIWAATVRFPLMIARQKAAHPPTFPQPTS